MIMDVASCRRFLFEHGFTTVKTGTELLPPFDIKRIPEALRTSAEWGPDLTAALLGYDALCAAQKETKALLHQEGGAADA